MSNIKMWFWGVDLCGRMMYLEMREQIQTRWVRWWNWGRKETEKIDLPDERNKNSREGTVMIMYQHLMAFPRLKQAFPTFSCTTEAGHLFYLPIWTIHAIKCIPIVVCQFLQWSNKYFKKFQNKYPPHNLMG